MQYLAKPLKRVYYASFLRKTFKKKQGKSNPSSHKNKLNKLKDNKESTINTILTT